MPSDLDPSSLAEPSRMLCPSCNRNGMRRVKRTGLFQTRIFPIFGYYPWECSFCRAVKLFKSRGGRRSRRTQGTGEPG
jgi:hypothetical protein